MLHRQMSSTLGVAAGCVLLRLKQGVQQGRIVLPVLLLPFLP